MILSTYSANIDAFTETKSYKSMALLLEGHGQQGHEPFHQQFTYQPRDGICATCITKSKHKQFLLS